MSLLRLLKTENAFTLIEMMIAVAIIGLLAAIAIPNFIAYRNKSFCTNAESDANGVASAISDYFAVPLHNQTLAPGDLNGGNGYQMTGNNLVLNIQGADPNANITIVVNDGSGRCPNSYQTAMNAGANAKAFWDGANNFTLLIRP